jgi:peptidoglycan biosynthesis protein MviN/MurJ (putative lipid II flippase)
MVRLAGFGHAGLALSASIVSTFSSLALLFLLRPKIGGLHGRELLVGLAKIVVAAGVMGVLCRGVVMASHSLLGGGALARAVDVVTGVPVGALSFYGMAAALKVPELANARAQVLRKLRRSG